LRFILISLDEGPKPRLLAVSESDRDADAEVEVVEFSNCEFSEVSINIGAVFAKCRD
jgi:hypothetical protein